MDWSREIQGINDPAVLKISDAWKKAHSSKDCSFLNALVARKAKMLERYRFFFCMERNARVDTLKSIATPERDFIMNLYQFLFNCNFQDVCHCSRCHQIFFFFSNTYFIM